MLHLLLMLSTEWLTCTHLTIPSATYDMIILHNVFFELRRYFDLDLD